MNAIATRQWDFRNVPAVRRERRALVVAAIRDFFCLVAGFATICAIGIVAGA